MFGTPLFIPLINDLCSVSKLLIFYVQVTQLHIFTSIYYNIGDAIEVKVDGASVTAVSTWFQVVTGKHRNFSKFI